MAKVAVAQRNRMLDALSVRCDNGYLRIYDGTRPANADAALSSNTLLAELRMNADAFPAASGGVLTANAITKDSSANAGGTPSFGRIFESDGTTVVEDVSVGTSGAGDDGRAVDDRLGAEI